MKGKVDVLLPEIEKIELNEEEYLLYLIQASLAFIVRKIKIIKGVLMNDNQFERRMQNYS